MVPALELAESLNAFCLYIFQFGPCACKMPRGSGRKLGTNKSLAGDKHHIGNSLVLSIYYLGVTY